MLVKIVVHRWLSFRRAALTDVSENVSFILGAFWTRFECPQIESNDANQQANGNSSRKQFRNNRSPRGGRHHDYEDSVNAYNKNITMEGNAIQHEGSGNAAG